MGVPFESNEEKLAKFLAELINGGDWDDPNFFAEQHKRVWREKADQVLKFVNQHFKTYP